ncbi:MAG: hypothetical protein H6587_09820 [Flavobacteriales bacterium]|nr:hypothetical protein [Flavobacteriales bacterium]
MKLITITERIGTTQTTSHLINDNIDRLIRTRLGLDEYDKYSILKMSQSVIDESTEGNNQALLIISLLIEME